jgi:hypothetical protein
VAVAQATATVEFGQVETLGLEGDGPCTRLQRRPAIGEQAFQLGPDLVEAATSVLSLVRIQCPQAPTSLGDHRRLPQEITVEQPKRIEVASGRYRGGGIGEVLV